MLKNLVPSSSPDKPLRSDGLIISLIFVACFLALIVMTEVRLIMAAPFILAGCGAVWIYLRGRRQSRAAAKPIHASQEIRSIRGQVLEDVTDALPRAIIALDRNADVIYANQAAFDLLSPDLIGRPIGAYLRSSEVRSYVERAFKGEIPPSLPVHVLQPTERHIDVDFSRNIAIDLHETRSSLIFAVLADRTQAKIDREQRADFLANASHELKTPIASLKGYIETLRGPAKDDPKARDKFLKIMSEQTERMERLVTDLLSLRRIESSEHLAPSETADLRRAIEAARDALTVLAVEKNVNLKIDLPEEQTAPTLGKTDECVQLFLNLLENAIKLSPEGAAVNLTLERLPNWFGQAFEDSNNNLAGYRRIVNLTPSDHPVWRVIITDKGPGFSRAHLPRIGERFYRVAGDLPSQEKGTGLGLAIVKHIVMRHRSGLYVKSLHPSYHDEKNQVSGTSFSVIFPAKETAKILEASPPRLK